MGARAPRWRARSTTVVLGGAAAMLLIACGGGGGLDVGALERQIADRGSADLAGADVGTATCPDDVSVDVGGSFECTLEIDGQTVPFTVTRGDQSYDFRPAERVAATEIRTIEDAVAAFVLQNESLDVAADCGGDDARTWLITVAKTEVACTVDYGGLVRGVAVTVRRTGEVADIAWSQARLDYGVVADRVGQQLVGELGGAFYLSCPDTFPDESAVVALDPGATFACTAVRNFAEIGAITVRVDDVNGALTATLAGK